MDDLENATRHVGLHEGREDVSPSNKGTGSLVDDRTPRPSRSASPYVVSASPGRELDTDATVDQEGDEEEISGEYEKPSFLGHARIHGCSEYLSPALITPFFPPPSLHFLLQFFAFSFPLCPTAGAGICYPSFLQTCSSRNTNKNPLLESPSVRSQRKASSGTYSARQY